MDMLTEILHRHGAMVLFGVVLAEQLGLPVPALPLLVAAGVLIHTGHVDLLAAIAAAFLATVLADVVWYLAGRWRGRSVLGLLCRIALEPDACVRRTEDFFRTQGPPSLVLAKFVPGLSTIAPPMAGVVGLGPVLFLLYDSVGTLLWVGSGLGLGYAFGAGAPDVAAQTAHMTPFFGVAAGGVIVGYVAWKRWRRRRELGGAPRMTVSQARRIMDAGESILFVDLRSAGDRADLPGISGAAEMTLEHVAQAVRLLPRDRPIVFYCACPEDVSSAQATLLLQRAGFTRVWALSGGIHAWHASGQKPLARRLVALESVTT